MSSPIGFPPQPEWKGTIRELADQGVSREPLNVLDQSGARTPESILSLLESFPSLSERGLLNAAQVSNAVKTVEPSARYVTLMEAREIVIARQFNRVLGALPPPNSEWALNHEVALLDSGSVPSASAPLLEAEAATPGQVIDLRSCMPWPVRNQGDRGTCVSFAMTALCELKACELDKKGTDLSEQFLYWATKTQTGDKRPGEAGTLLEYSLEALQSHGIPVEIDWPYNPNVIPGNESHGAAGAPSAAVLQAALPRRSAGNYSDVKVGSAARILALLKLGKAVAISLPVAEDPLSHINNWATAVGVRFGIVLDPPPTSVLKGGHAVAVTGFVADPIEPNGGYFIIRNSWSGNGWGHMLPNATGHGPEPGYGQVSATYVEEYLWEYAFF